MKKYKVLKFGGTSLASPESIKKVKQIIEETNNVKAIVVSAPGKSNEFSLKVTDALILAHLKKDKFNYYMNYVKLVLFNIISNLEIDFDLDKELNKITWHYRIFKTKSYLISRGEYLSAKILSKYLNIPFIDSKNVIKFAKDGKLHPKTYKNIQSIAKTHDKFIVSGFYGSNTFSKIKLMSRGGSDITGSVVSRALKNAVYENYTDVDGLKDISPKLKTNTRVISKINYKDMYFLSFYGASVLHYKCSKIFNNGFTVIKNTFNNSAITTKLNPKYKNIKFALSITSGYQIVFNEKNKSVYKLLQKLHHEKLYSFSRLGLCFYGFRTSTLNNCEKILFNLKKYIKEYKKILVYALIGDLSKLKQKIQNKHKDFIFCFYYKNKTNIVYYDE